MIGTLDTMSGQRQQRLGFLLDGICGQVPGVPRDRGVR